MRLIFIVDDNQTNLIAAQQALDGVYGTMQINSAEKMFQMLEKVIPDLILLDIEMPAMDGFAALLLLMQSPRFRSIPVVMLTAHGLGEIVSQCVKSGAKGFVVKPFDRDILLMNISRALNGGS